MRSHVGGGEMLDTDEISFDAACVLTTGMMMMMMMSGGHFPLARPPTSRITRIRLPRRRLITRRLTRLITRRLTRRLARRITRRLARRLTRRLPPRRNLLPKRMKTTNTNTAACTTCTSPRVRSTRSTRGTTLSTGTVFCRSTHTRALAHSLARSTEGATLSRYEFEHVGIFEKL